MERNETWNFKIPIVGTGRNKKEAFEDAIEATDLGYTDIDNCEGELESITDENGDDIE